jgi:hypothetical protein
MLQHHHNFASMIGSKAQSTNNLTQLVKHLSILVTFISSSYALNFPTDMNEGGCAYLEFKNLHLEYIFIDNFSALVSGVLGCLK